MIIIIIISMLIGQSSRSGIEFDKEKDRIIDWLSLTEPEKEWHIYYQKQKFHPIINCVNVQNAGMDSFSGFLEPIIITEIIEPSGVVVPKKSDEVRTYYGNYIVTGTMPCQFHGLGTAEVWIEGLDLKDISGMKVGKKCKPDLPLIVQPLSIRSTENGKESGIRQRVNSLGQTITYVVVVPITQTRSIQELVKIVPPKNPKIFIENQDEEKGRSQRKRLIEEYLLKKRK